MNHHEQAKLGQQASKALPAIDAAFDVVKEGLTRKMLAESPMNRDQILSLHAAIQSVDAARQAVRQVIATGQLSEAAIAAEKQL